MATRIAMGGDARQRLRRLAVLFAVELRMKIVVESYMREMSSKQFHEEFGGGSLARVSQNFRSLEKEEWLRWVRSEGPGGDRHGGVEHFYRATEPPFIDGESWALLPYSVRVTSSWNMFKQVAPRLRADIEAANNEADLIRELTCTAFVLDDLGFRRANDAMGDQFVRLYEEQEDARRRVAHSGEELIRADIFLIAFQSPSRGMALPVMDSVLVDTREPFVPFAERFAPILRDEMRRAILSELNEREVSVTQFHRAIGGASKSSVRRRFKGLELGGWAARGKTLTGGARRGAVEHYYRATKPAIRDYDPCADPPNGLSGTASWRTLQHLCDSMREAMTAGTFDARTDRWITWTLIRLDRQGWEKVVASLESLKEFMALEQKQAMQRMAESGEKPLTMTLGLGAYEAVKNEARAP